MKVGGPFRCSLVSQPAGRSANQSVCTLMLGKYHSHHWSYWTCVDDLFSKQT